VNIEKFLSLYVEKNLVVAYNVEGTFSSHMRHAAKLAFRRANENWNLRVTVDGLDNQ
jgi:hypothetical protein